jgi:hypothetical protein
LPASFAPGHIILSLPCGDKNGQNLPVKDWELVAENLSKGCWSWGCVSAVDLEGRTIWIADAHRGDGQWFIVHPDEVLTAFTELDSSIRLRRLYEGKFSAGSREKH